MKLENLPAAVTEQEIRDFFVSFDVSHIDIQEDASGASAVVLLSSQRHAKLASEALNRKRIRDIRVNASVHNVHDIGELTSVAV